MRAIWPSDEAIQRGRRRLHAKASGIAAFAIVSYWGLVFSDVGLIGRIASGATLAISVVAISTGIMHDANHGAFSRSRRVNRLVGWTADMLGASSWVWRFKHNTLHHAHTNVVGRDSDIEQAPFARLAAQQPWHPWHRYQHVYLWFLYGFLTIKWFVVSDVAALVKGGFGTDRFPSAPWRRDIAVIASGKVIHLGWAVVIPLLLHPWWVVLLVYLLGSWLVGFTLAMIFQLAHCTDEVEFLDASALGAHEPFEVRQLRTTADIECRLPILGAFIRWIMGGLDHQIEHHLAPRLPHTVYPMMAAELRRVCTERQLPCHVHPSLWSAVRSHGRWLQQLGRDPTSSSGVRAGSAASSAVRPELTSTSVL